MTGILSAVSKTPPCVKCRQNKQGWRDYRNRQPSSTSTGRPGLEMAKWATCFPGTPERRRAAASDRADAAGGAMKSREHAVSD